MLRTSRLLRIQVIGLEGGSRAWCPLSRKVNSARNLTFQRWMSTSEWKFTWMFGVSPHKVLDVAHWVGAITRDAEGSHMQLQVPL